MRSSAMLVCVSAATLAACNAPSLSKRPPLPVTVATAKVTDYAPSLSITGEIAARVSSNLSFRVSGRVTERMVDVGQHVGAGQVLARLDPAAAQADLDAANALVASGEAVLKQNTLSFDREKQLFDSGFATRTAFDAAQQNLRTAQSSLDNAKAQAETLADQLSYTNLKAEKSGIVTARLIEVGQIAQPAQTAFTVAEDGPRDAVFSVFEAVFLNKSPRRDLRLWLVANPSVQAVGRVREVSPTVNTRAGTVTVKVAVEATQDVFPLGAPVIGQGTFSGRPVVELPWSAAASDAGALAVWICDPATSAVSLKRVTAEAFDKERLIVSQGLSGGERVVVAGGKFLYPGMIVAPQEATP